MTSAILFQDQSRTVTLIDIPASISQAQITHDCLWSDRIYSSPALRSPHASLEAKSNKAKANVLRMNGSGEDGFPSVLLHQAIKVVQGNWEAHWCLDRRLLPQLEQSAGKRKASQEMINELIPKPSDVIAYQNGVRTSNAWEALELRAGGLDCPDAVPVMNRVVFNSSDDVNYIRFPYGRLYRIPPACSFLFSKIDSSTAMSFSMAALHRYPSQSDTTSATSGQFDFLLLDPPWENRSVRRSKDYGIPESEEDPMDILRSMLGQHIAPGGLVGCWITNKRSVRDNALTLFQDLGVELTEEWAWLKVTVKGEPVTDIDGLWRKPYEVLLIGRKEIVRTDDGVQSDEIPKAVQRRVIVAVPDLHSRKPSVKELIKPLIRGTQPHRVAEIFARNLTTGWWSWGDEVLKYQWDGYWSKGDTNVENQ